MLDTAVVVAVRKSPGLEGRFVQRLACESHWTISYQSFAANTHWAMVSLFSSLLLNQRGDCALGRLGDRASGEFVVTSETFVAIRDRVAFLHRGMHER